MKKLLAILMCLALVLSLTFVMTGCDKEDKKDDVKTSAESKEKDKNDEKEDSAKDDEEEYYFEDMEEDYETLVDSIDDLKDVYDELTEVVEGFNDGDISAEDVLYELIGIYDELSDFPHPVYDLEWKTKEFEESVDLLNDALDSLKDFVSISIEAFEEGDESLLEEANEYDSAYNEYMDELCEEIDY